MSRPFSLESFEKKFVKVDGCWEWLATKNSDGYGRVKRYGKLESAHRVSYELYKGKFNKEKHVCHSCDNPGCVNPDHLWLGDYTSNNLDKKLKGRAKSGGVFGTKHPGAKLQDTDIPMIIMDTRSHSKIALDYNVSHTLIQRIKARKAWKHVKMLDM